jgi:hypothetical protein
MYLVIPLMALLFCVVSSCKSEGPTDPMADMDDLQNSHVDLEDFISVQSDVSSPVAGMASLGEGAISVWFQCKRIPTDFGIAPIFYYGSANPCLNMFDAANQGLIIELGHSPVHMGSRRLYFTIFANGCTYPSMCFDSGTPLQESVWYHFVAVVGRSFNTGYLNGEEMSARRYNFGSAHDSQFFSDARSHAAMWVGRGYWDGRFMRFDGQIEDVRIYREPLGPQDVKALYAQGR